MRKLFFQLLLLLTTHALSEKTQVPPLFNQEQQIIESIRYQFEVEGESQTTRKKLASLINQSHTKGIQGQAQFLLGKILLQNGKSDSAVQLFQLALKSNGLQNTEKIWLYRKLLSLKSNTIKPFITDVSAIGEPSRIINSGEKSSPQYLLEFRNSPNPQWQRNKELALQNTDGNLLPLPLVFSAQEEIVDADTQRVLIQDLTQHKIRIQHFLNSQNFEYSMDEKIESGSFIYNDSNSFLYTTSRLLRVIKNGKLDWELPLKQEGCIWVLGDKRLGLGALQCAENKTYIVDLYQKESHLLENIKDKLLQITWKNNYLLLRFLDRIEMHKGPKFEMVKWSTPVTPQEKLYLGNESIYITNTRGMTRAFNLDKGALEWQKDLLANQLVAFDQNVFVSTYDKKVLCLDLAGKVIWSYEYGWNREPLLLPAEHWLVLQFLDGHRIKLDRELLRITGNANTYKFLDYPKLVQNKNWNAALYSLESLLKLEPGNGVAWMLRARTLKNSGANKLDLTESLVESSRSAETPPWSNGPILKNLAENLNAHWVWKRQYSPKFYPNLVPHKEYVYYLENDNQTMVVLNHETGELINSFRFSEDLDFKINLWKNDTICISSPSRLYLLSPTASPSNLTQISLKSPVCQAQAVTGGIVMSDWNGNLSLLSLPEKNIRWEKKIGNGGLFISKNKNFDYLDVVDLEGNYFSVQPSSGKINWSLRMPSGTITDFFTNKDFIFAAYNQGTLVALNRSQQIPAWTIDLGEQIFCLTGNRDNTLLITTASKKLICVQASTGAILSQVHLQSYIFNRPTVFDRGYWIGTNEPALEKRNFNHELLLKYKLPDLPGSPTIFGNSIFIGTLDNFIMSFPS